MNILILAALGYVAYTLLSKDDRPAKMREAASAMFAQAQQLETAMQFSSAQSLRSQADALVAQAVGIESGRIK